MYVRLRSVPRAVIREFQKDLVPVTTAGKAQRYMKLKRNFLQMKRRYLA